MAADFQAERTPAQRVMGGLDELLVDEGVDGLFDEDLPAACPRERRAADIRFAVLTLAIVLVATFGAILPGHCKRGARLDRYGEIVRETAKLRQELAELRRLERRLEARDPYLIERLARDRMMLVAPGEERLFDEAPSAAGGRSSR